MVPGDNWGKVSVPDRGASEVTNPYKFLPLSLSHSSLLCLLHHSLDYCHNVLGGFSFSICFAIHLPLCCVGTKWDNYKATGKARLQLPEMFIDNENLAWDLIYVLNVGRKIEDICEILVPAIFMTFQNMYCGPAFIYLQSFLLNDTVWGLGTTLFLSLLRWEKACKSFPVEYLLYLGPIYWKECRPLLQEI